MTRRRFAVINMYLPQRNILVRKGFIFMMITIQWARSHNASDASLNSSSKELRKHKVDGLDGKQHRGIQSVVPSLRVHVLYVMGNFNRTAKTRQ